MNAKLEFLKDAFLTKIHLTSKNIKSFPWENRDAYACWLAQTYYFVRHTTTFLSLSASKFGHKNKEALSQVLKHLREETGHEKLLIEDLRAINRNFYDFLEFPETSLFYQSQYYWINNDHPAAHSGYSLFLEGLAAECGDSAFLKVSKVFGSNTASFLKVHNGVDKKHFQEGLRQIADHEDEIYKSILQNLEQSFFLYQRILKKSQKPSEARIEKLSPIGAMR
jgi:pyrroloquinoline quinone (PQQ) biosynthesis protein C